MNNGILLYTTYHGKPVVGGSYNPLKQYFVKKCKHRSGGRHPHLPAHGGIDADIVEQLDKYGCKTIQLRLADGSVFYIRYDVFKAHGFVVDWRDPRFGPRWYAMSQFWHTSLGKALEASPAPEASAAEPERDRHEERNRQLSLFDTDPTPGERRQAYEQGHGKPSFSSTGRWA